MPRASLPVPPFPATIDRTYFAAYLSGLTDGEGSFCLTLRHPGNRCKTPYASFQMCLRADDKAILELIRSFLGCGLLSHQYGSGTRRDSYRYFVSNITHLTSIVIPHFEKNPLLAKKQSDFRIWREGVLYIRHVIAIPKTRRGHKGAFPRWTPERLAHFQSLAAALDAAREYQAPPIDLPKPPPPPPEPGLFD